MSNENISLDEIKDMYFNIFQKNPRGRKANDKLYLLNKINEAANKSTNKSSTKKNINILKKDNILSETSIKNTLQPSNDKFEYMDDISINMKLTNDEKSFYSKNNKTPIDCSHCKKYKNLNEIDLNKIKISKIKNSICTNLDSNEYFDKNKYYKITYDNKIDFCNIKYINEGSFGSVYMYSNKGGKYKIAVKKYFDNDDDEINIYKLLLSKGINCNIINMKIIEYRPLLKKYYVGVMDFMHGSLSDLKGKLDETNFLKVIKEIAISLRCLNEKELSYTDLKTDNVLYKCVDNKLKITLGDIGSICRSGDYNSCTFLPIEYYKTGGFPKCSESSMVWGLGVIALELLNFNVKYFHYSNISKFKENDIRNKHKIYIYHKYYIPVMTKFKNYFKFKKNKLNINQFIFGIFFRSSDRLTLDDIINSIS